MKGTHGAILIKSIVHCGDIMTIMPLFSDKVALANSGSSLFFESRAINGNVELTMIILTTEDL